MKYLVLELMASFKVHKLSSVLCTPEMCLPFFFSSYNIWLNKIYCFCWQNFPSGKTCLFLVCCRKRISKKPTNSKQNQYLKQMLLFKQTVLPFGICEDLHQTFSVLSRGGVQKHFSSRCASGLMVFQLDVKFDERSSVFFKAIKACNKPMAHTRE